MQKCIGTYKGKINIEGNETEVSARACRDIIEVRSTQSSEPHKVPGLMEWYGTGILDFETAIKLISKNINTEIGTIIITMCNERDNKIHFAGTGEPNFILR